MPLTAIIDDFVRTEIVGRVDMTGEGAGACSKSHLTGTAETVGNDPGQLLNMLFGNTSLHDDIVAAGCRIATVLIKPLGGPRHGLHGIAARVGATGADLPAQRSNRRVCLQRTRGSCRPLRAAVDIHYIKDDHGLPTKPGFPLSGARRGGRGSLGVPSDAGRRPSRAIRAEGSAGDLDTMQRADRRRPPSGHRYRADRADGSGLVQLHRLVPETIPAVAFIAHPTMAGAARIAARVPAGDVVPHPGGRRRGVPELWRTVRLLAADLPGAGAGGTGSRNGMRPCMPVPAAA